MRRKTWKLKLALLLASTGIALSLAEIGVRLGLPYYRPSAQIVFHIDADGVPLGPAGERVRVSTPKGDWDIDVNFNRHGLRDPKDLTQARADDLFAVGDSFTFGWGIEDGRRFSDIIERMTGRPVFNIAIPGDLRDYARLVHYAERRGAKVRQLIIGVCMENDLKDYRAAAVAAPSGPAPTRERVRVWLKTHSALYLAASHILQARLGAGRLFEKLGVARSVEQLTAQNSFDEQILASSCEEIAALAADRDAIVLLIPSRGLWSGTNQQTERRVHERFAALLAERGLRVLDMRPVFEAGGSPLDYYFTTDPHWNARGHAAAAEALVRARAH